MNGHKALTINGIRYPVLCLVLVPFLSLTLLNSSGDFYNYQYLLLIGPDKVYLLYTLYALPEKYGAALVDVHPARSGNFFRMKIEPIKTLMNSNIRINVTVKYEFRQLTIYVYRRT